MFFLFSDNLRYGCEASVVQNALNSLLPLALSEETTTVVATESGYEITFNSNRGLNDIEFFALLNLQDIFCLHIKTCFRSFLSVVQWDAKCTPIFAQRFSALSVNF